MPINSEILRWARESSGYSLEEIAVTSGFSKFPKWESGELMPSYSQLEKIAEKLHRPIALFFFPSIPEEESIEKSLRSISEEDIHNLSPHIRHLFRKARAFQISLKELQGDSNSNRIKWLGKIEGSNVKKIASQVREILGIGLSEQESWKDADMALKNWRSVLADKGIFVFKEAFKNDRVAGFCIYDEIYPIIFINNSLSFNRQVFTVFHELAHIIFKQSYLDIFYNKFWQLENSDPSHIEVKCNEFAGEFLVPEESFLSSCKGMDITDDTLSKLAEKFNVSRYVILRRFLTHKFIDKDFYQNKVLQWEQAYATKKKKEPDKKTGGDYYNSKISYLGEAYLSLVISNYIQGRIDIETAAQHLDVKQKSFLTIEDKFISRGVSDVHI